MTTLGKLFVVSQFILSMAFAIIAGLFLQHRLPWNPPTPGAGAQAIPGLIEDHEKKIKVLAAARDRAEARWNAYNTSLAAHEAERPIRQRLFDAKLAMLRTGLDPNKAQVQQAVTAVEYDPRGLLKLVGAAPVQFRAQDTLAFDPIVAELRRLNRNEQVNGVAMLGPIPKTQLDIETLLKDYDTLTIDVNGQGAVRGLIKEIGLQEEFRKNAVIEQDSLKPELANRYSETVLLLQRQNALLARKQELQKIGVAAGTVP